MLHRNTVSLLAIFAAIILLASCGGDEKEDNGAQRPPFALNDPSKVARVPVVRLDTAIARFTDLDKDSRMTFIDQNKELLWGYGEIVDGGELPVDEITVLSWATNEVTQLAVPEVEKAIPDLGDLQKKLGVILATARQNKLDLPERSYVAVTWANPKSIINFDTIPATYIALNHYLGADHPFYNESFSDGARALKTPDMMAVDLAEALTANRYPYAPPTDNVISRMLYDGVMAVVKEAMVPDATTAQILGFDPKDMKDIESREAATWRQLLTDNKIYSTDPAVISNLFEPRPASTLIGADAPGRVVRYNGYRIVREYISRHPDVTLKELLSPDFYGNGMQVLSHSGYGPK